MFARISALLGLVDELVGFNVDPWYAAYPNDGKVEYPWNGGYGDDGKYWLYEFKVYGL